MPSETLSQKTKQHTKKQNSCGLEDLRDKAVIQDGTTLQVKAKDRDIDDIDG